MSHKLVLATRNQGKITEFRRILEELAPGQIELIGVDKFPDLVDVEETICKLGEYVQLPSVLQG